MRGAGGLHERRVVDRLPVLPMLSFVFPTGAHNEGSELAKQGRPRVKRSIAFQATRPQRPPSADHCPPEKARAGWLVPPTLLALPWSPTAAFGARLATSTRDGSTGPGSVTA